MSAIEMARALDSQDSPVAAAWAFEVATRLEQLEPLDYVALAFIYFNAGDFGYSSHHRLPQEFVETSDQLWRETLSTGARNYPVLGELSFWIDLFSFLRENDVEARDRLTSRLESPEDLLAKGLWGFAFLEREEYLGEGELLLRACREEKSSRDRYISGVLAPRLARRNTSSRVG
jgi:hypothetical protein